MVTSGGASGSVSYSESESAAGAASTSAMSGGDGGAGEGCFEGFGCVCLDDTVVGWGWVFAYSGSLEVDLVGSGGDLGPGCSCCFFCCRTSGAGGEGSGGREGGSSMDRGAAANGEGLGASEGLPFGDGGTEESGLDVSDIAARCRDGQK